MSNTNAPDWAHDGIRVTGSPGNSVVHKVPLGYEREDILPGCDMMPDPHIAVLRRVSVTCGLCHKENVETALEVDTSGCEYDVLFLCADCVQRCFENMKG